MTQRVCVMPAHHLEIQQFPAAARGGADKLFNRWQVPAGKNIARQPPVHRRGAAVHRDAVDQRDAARRQKVGNPVKIGGIVSRPDMFQHADRHDSVKAAPLVTVIEKLKIQCIRHVGLLCGQPCIGQLTFGQRDSAHAYILAACRKRPRQPAPATADIKNAISVLQVEFGGNAGKLADLCCLERVFIAVKIGAGILPPGIKEAIEQLIRQVIVMRHIAARPSRQVQVPEYGKQIAKAQRHPPGPMP